MMTQTTQHEMIQKRGRTITTSGWTLLACVSAAALILASFWLSSDITRTLILGGFCLLACLSMFPRLASRTNPQSTSTLGRYHLVEPIGSGGMGEVWRARHELLGRDAAVKMIRREALKQTSPDQAASLARRFEREARATASLRSPHTVALHDYGFSDGSFYYVMELLDGMDLDAFVEQYGPQSAARTIYLLRQVCAALAEAHAKGLVHRDIKPRNLMLCRLGLTVDFVKVLDFGLVKVERAALDTQLTVDGLTTGTPAYIAPEVALGQEDVDARADIYGLGCVAYWLLTGQLVFDAGSPLAMAVAHAHKAPVPPSQRTELPVPAALERVVLACLEKDPNLRPQTVRELDALLAACDAGDPWTSERAERWWSAHLPSPILSQPALAAAA